MWKGKGVHHKPMDDSMRIGMVIGARSGGSVVRVKLRYRLICAFFLQSESARKKCRAT